MSEEHIPVITDREKLYDKCENMEQLFDKYYLPLLDKHYSKTYKLQKENQLLKHRLETANDFIDDRKENMIPEHYEDLKYIINECYLNSSW